MSAESAFLLTLGRMTYPKGSSAFVSYSTLQAEAQYIASTRDDLDELGDVKQGAGELANKVLNAFERASTGGNIAGETLLKALTIAEYAPEHLSINKVMWLVYSQAQDDWSTHDGSRVPKTKKTLMTFWSKYKSVAHLWAAFRSAQAAEGDPLVAVAPLITDDGLMRFFANARHLCGLADDLELPLGKGTLKEMQANLPGLNSPLSQAEATLTIPPLTDWARNKLAEYRADDWRDLYS